MRDNFILSITRQVRRNMIVDIRYIGTFSRDGDTTFNLNTPNVYSNKELYQALADTRAGQDSPLFDQMFAGLDIHGTAGTGYGPVGTVTSNGVLQRGSAQLRRNSSFSANLANGNFVNVVNSLITLNTVQSGLQTAPKNADGTNVSGISARVLRNGCDRLANGFQFVQQSGPALVANPTPLRCFPEDYFVTNPQLSSANLHENFGRTNYHSLQAQYTLRPTQGISFQATWAWEKNMGTADAFGFADPTHPERDYSEAWSTTPMDFRINGTFELPIGPNKFLLGNTSGWKARLLERWSVSLIERYAQGQVSEPYGSQMTYVGGGGPRPYSRPDIVGPWIDPKLDPVWVGDFGWAYGYPSPFTNFADPQCKNNVANGAIPSNPDSGTGPGQFNFGANCSLVGLARFTSKDTPGAWAVLDSTGNPTGQYAVSVLQNSMPGVQGTMGAARLRIPSRNLLDGNISKTFKLGETKNLVFRADATNILNHPTIGYPTFAIGGAFGRIPGAGQVAKSANPRVFQAQIRLTF